LKTRVVEQGLRVQHEFVGVVVGGGEVLDAPGGLANREWREPLVFNFLLRVEDLEIETDRGPWMCCDSVGLRKCS
jgi:hypothetical protein